MKRREVTHVIRLKRKAPKGLTQMFCLTVTDHKALKEFFAVLL